MPTRNVNLTEHFDTFVNTQIASGQFSNASEVVRAGLRLLEQQKLEHQHTLARLREVIDEGIADLESGRSTHLGNRREVKAFLDQIGEEVSEKTKQSPIPADE
jgi:antitoxin ParD1/3/4